VNNLTVLSYFNATIISYNVTGNMQIEGNITASHITGNISTSYGYLAENLIGLPESRNLFNATDNLYIWNNTGNLTFNETNLNRTMNNLTNIMGFLRNDSIINATILNVTQKVNTWNLTVKGNTTLASYTYFNSTTNTYTGYGGICFNGSVMVISSNVTRSMADTTNPWCK
jgi:hypothetical protein